jgi:hypothetical protein
LSCLAVLPLRVSSEAAHYTEPKRIVNIIRQKNVFFCGAPDNPLFMKNKRSIHPGQS